MSRPRDRAAEVARVAAACRVRAYQVGALVDEFTERRVPGLIGEPRANVLRLSIALDARYPASR